MANGAPGTLDERSSHGRSYIGQDVGGAKRHFYFSQKMARVSYPAIRSNLVYLVRNLSVDHLRPLMMEESLITHEEHRKLANCSWSEQEKAEELLISILPHKGKLGLEVFVKCLVWSGQLEAARKLSVSEEDIERFISENPHNKLEETGMPLLESESVNCPAGGYLTPCSCDSLSYPKRCMCTL